MGLIVKSLSEFESYADALAGFSWPALSRYNIASVCCDAWAASQGERTALVIADTAGRPISVSYRALQDKVNRCANVLTALRIGRGDRVAVHLGQTLHTVLVHLAVYKIGAVTVPLAAVFGPEAIAYRMERSGASLIVTSREGVARMPPMAAKVVVADAADAGGLDALMSRAASSFDAAETAPDDPAMMIFTSGTTGQPKGAMHGHRVLLGHLPGVQMHHDLMPQHGDRLWTPADWAWAGGLLNVLLPGLAMGVPVVAQRETRFDPQEALDWAAEAGVRNAFIPPTALRMMRDANPKVSLRSVGSGGEQLGAATFEWGLSRLGITINEFYGQTECNLVLSSCAAWGIATPGIIGRPVPGHEVAVIDAAGCPVPEGEQGTVAIKAPDPVMFLGYHDNAAGTADKFIGCWMTTGDQGVAGPHGIRFVGRDDDVISSGGYRIGPGEIESCLAGHPAVSLAAVVGKPDPLRGEIVAAFVRLAPGASPDEALKADIQTFVRERLSAHEYPREITFVDDVPLTSTGKVIRRAFR
ncbi:MAG: AMP-binding protein [Pseudomonadota bacterium]